MPRQSHVDTTPGSPIQVFEDGTYANNDGWDKQHFFELVVLHCLEHAVHGEGGEHVDIGIEQDRQVHLLTVSVQNMWRVISKERKVIV